MPGSREVTEEQAAKLVVRAVAAVVAFLLASSLALLVDRTDEQPALAARVVQVDAVGPLPGTDIGRYAASRRAALDQVAERTLAVVSLAGYVDEPSARRMARRAGVDLVALLVAAPNGSPQAVTGGLEGWLADERRRAEAERDELATILETTTDPDFIDQYEQDIARLERLVARLSSVRELVFGFAVVGSPERLRALADDPDVRLVDPGSSTTRPPLADLRGLRPEETTRAGEPRTRPD